MAPPHREPEPMLNRAAATESRVMNGAESLVRTLVAGGVDGCFANPGTSEMHFVAALDRVEGMRCVLGLFEGVVTGAADGYFRMRGTPTSRAWRGRCRRGCAPRRTRNQWPRTALPPLPRPRAARRRSPR